MSATDAEDDAAPRSVRWIGVASAAALRQVACRRILDAAAHAIERRRRFLIVLAGGNTPRGIYRMLRARDTSFVLISRAALAKLEAYKTLRGWRWPWVSSYGSPFNYDFHVTHDESVAPPEYNYRDKAELEQRTHEPYLMSGESHGLSVFFRINDDVFHTYSTYARGCEGLTDAYSLLDRTPYGRQEDFENWPPGWPQKPTYG